VLISVERIVVSAQLGFFLLVLRRLFPQSWARIEALLRNNRVDPVLQRTHLTLAVGK